MSIYHQDDYSTFLLGDVRAVRAKSKLEGHLESHGDGYLTSAGQAWQDWRDANPNKTIGWQPTCEHTGDPIPCTVLDPFGGSGTTAYVARKMGRRAILIDLKREYLDMAVERCRQAVLL